MKRATALQVLAATLVLLTVASAIPLALILQADPSPAPGASSPGSGDDGSSPSSPGAATLGLPFGPAGNPDAESRAAGAGGRGGPSSRPGSAGADARGSGSALLDQVLGAAALMGHDLQVPDLPIDKLDPANPLRAAILGWVAATGADVPADELARELARADALPMGLQRDLALLVVSATEATLLQRQATAFLTPEQLAWIYAHPEVADDLARGVSTPDTRAMAALAALVDTEKSLQAALLLLTAVEATRGSLQSPASAEALGGLDAFPQLDPATRAVLTTLASAGTRVTDQDKVRFAAELVAATSGVALPAVPAPASFGDAVARLVAATGQVPDAAETEAVLARADALPDDLERALASAVLAQALAVEAARPGAGEDQAVALARVLLAVADALPVLEKYSLYWSQAPDALRVGQWSPQARLGWAAEHAALLASTHGAPADVVRAVDLVHGIGVQDVDVPDRSFADAYAALSASAGGSPTPEALAAVRAAGERLDPRVAEAAARLMSGAAESARLQDVAYARLSPLERWTLLQPRDLDAVYLKPQPTAAEIEELKLVARLAARVDREALARAQLVAVQAVDEARGILDGLQTQGEATPVATGWAALLQKLLPWRVAEAQGATCVDFRNLVNVAALIEADCERDILLRISDPGFASLPQSVACSAGMFVASGESVTSLADPTRLRVEPESFSVYFEGDDAGGSGGYLRECVGAMPDANRELLVITGPGSAVSQPPALFRFPSACTDTSCTFTPAPGYGAARVYLDLGGRDTYQRPVAMTFPGQILPVSLHLDMGGNDYYTDPSGLYDEQTPLWAVTLQRDGHPTQGSAAGGGVAVLMDVHQPGDSGDRFEASALSQGYGQWGLGMVVDTGGNENYLATRWAQGAAGRDFNLGAGILVDHSGDDSYAVESGQGYGVGGALLDLSGRDVYDNEHPAFGAPIVHLDVLPAENLTTLTTRGDDRAWIDGPAELNLGLGLDVEYAVVGGGRSDSDAYPDFVETLAGTDPRDSRDNPETRPTSQLERIATDADRDTWPDFIERALGSDEEDAASYPLGLPAGPTFVLPAPVGEVSAGDASSAVPTSGLRGSDKILDLRMPLQDAGTVDFACFGPFAPQSAPLQGDPRANTLNLTLPGVGTQAWGEGYERDDGPCVIVGYRPTGPGEAEVGSPTQPLGQQGMVSNGQPVARNNTLRFPTGILAIGDAVATNYTADYFLVIDLGGDDNFTNRAGGGLPVLYKESTGVTRSAFAPSLVVNVDTTGALAGAQGTGAGADVTSADSGAGHDVYALPANQTGDYFTQGSLWGVLVDTQGDDRYTAGGGSQGSLGGVLLDLAGRDTYAAGDLSQGATALAAPASPSRYPGAPATLPEDSLQSGMSDGAVRRVPPGLHLDLGSGDDTRVSGNASQGFGRGFAGATQSAGAGILLDEGGNDRYLSGRAQHVQGVGGYQAMGLLVDLAGDDQYEASGLISQGASVSPTLGTGSTDARPGLAALLDLGGADAYAYVDAFGLHDRTPARQDNLTVQRGRMGEAYADPALHYDGEGVSLNALAGSGGRDFTSVVTPESTVGDFYVDMPNARLAIGGPGATTYATEYALVVDLGGANAYHNNAGGVVPDLLATSRQAQTAGKTTLAGGALPKVALFPVSLVVDAGHEGSTYAAQRGLVQGAGYFSVGVLVDMGGPDRFVSTAGLLPSVSSAWAAVTPAIDGSVDESLWNAIEPVNVTLVAANESRAFERVRLRVANDAKNVYVAIEGTSPSGASDRLKDGFIVSLQPGRDFAHAYDGTAIDETLVTVSPKDDCSVLGDTRLQGAKDLVTDGASSVHGRAACVYRSDGNYTIEIAKPLVPGIPRDAGDLALRYDEKKGFDRAAAQMGLRIEHYAEAARDTFAWPAGSVRADGAGGHLLDDTLRDETRAWAVLALGSLGEAGVPKPFSRNASVAQGAGLAGVGILAHLGTTDSSGAYLATERAQGFGAFGGLGLLLDAGGSDTYVGSAFVQGAAEATGSLGALVDLEGNDVYRAAAASQGYTPSTDSPFAANWPAGDTGVAAPRNAQSLAFFVDFNGRDEYDVTSPAKNRDDVTTPTPLGHLEAWVQGGGYGADYFSDDSLRAGLLQALYADTLYGSSRTSMSLVQPTETGDGCSGTTLDETFEGRKVATGRVCLQAVVDLSRAPSTPANVELTLDGLDFLVDGHRIATLNASLAKKLDAKAWRFQMLLDTTAIDDGVTTFTGQAIVRATINATTGGVATGPRGVVVFYDQSVRGNERASVLALVNNPARTQLEMHPLLDADAPEPGIVSPLSADPEKRALLIDWNVSRDAGEDRYELANGWRAPPELTNVPCAEGSAKLCTLYPFYLRDTTTGDDKYLHTEPVYHAYGRYDQRAGENSAYTVLIPSTSTPMTLHKTDAFHLRLNTHKALFAAAYTTTIQIFLRPTDGGNDILLGEEVATSEQNLGVTQAPPPVVQERIASLRQTVTPPLEGVGKGSFFTDVLRTVYGACSPSIALACDAMFGNPGAPPSTGPQSQTIHPCRRDQWYPATSAINTAGNAINDQVKGTRVCQPVSDDLNETAAGSLDPLVTGVGGEAVGDVFDQVAGLFTTPNPNPLHWNDFYIDVQAPSIPADLPQVADMGDALVVPPGYDVVFKMQIDASGLDGPDLSTMWRQVVLDNLNGVFNDLILVNSTAEAAASVAANAAVNAAQCSRNPGCTPASNDFNGTLGDAVRVPLNGTETSIDQGVERTLSMPVTAYFMWGDSQSGVLPARIEMRLASVARTAATAVIEDIATNEPVATLFADKPVVGDVEGTPLNTIIGYHNDSVERHPIYLTQRNVYNHSSDAGPARYASAREPGFAGAVPSPGLRFTQMRLPFDGTTPFGGVPDGLWRLNITAKDDTNEVESTRLMTFILDTTAPASGVMSNGFAGSGAFENGAIPITWAIDETGSGVARTWVFYKIGEGLQRCGTGAVLSDWCPARIGKDGDATPWDPAKEWFGPNEHAYPFRPSGSEEYYFLTISQDRAGNIEYGQGAQGTLAEVLAAARDAKASVGGSTRIVVDQTLPSAQAVGIVDGLGLQQRRGFQGQEFTFVRAGQPITFKACARDSAGSGVGVVTFHLDQLRANASPLHREFDGAEVSDALDECPSGWRLFAYSGWGQLNTNKTEYPDGTWTIAAQVTDSAGNHVKVGMGSLILDSLPPAIRVEPPMYPSGQSAVKPGDRLTLRLYATDPFGVDDQRITIDASPLTKSGVVSTRPVRVSGVLYYETSFAVDAPNVRNGLFELPVRVVDNAGNLNTSAFVVAVDFKTFTIPPASLRVDGATHRSVVVHWNTTEPTTASVRYGTSPLELKMRSATNSTLSTQHSLVVEGLDPSTRYFMRAVSSTAGGYLVESDVVEAVTDTALYLRPLGPASGAAVSGPVDVRFEGGLRDSSEFVTFTLEAQPAPDAPWSFVTTTTEQSGNHTLVFNSTRFLDGPSYRLRLTAEAGKDRAVEHFGPVLSDNTPPRVAVLSPLVATNDTTPAIVAEATDNLALFGADAIALSIDGKAIENLTPVLSGDAVRIAYDLAEPLEPGRHAIELRVKDKAGNVVVEAWNVAIDGDAPVVSANAARYAPGREAAKLGGTVTLNVTVKDVSGVDSVVAGVEGIGKPGTVRFARVTGTDAYVGTFTVTSAEAAAVHPVTIVATDLAGNTQAVVVEVPVDNVPPKVGEVRAGDIGQTRAMLIADADEPVVLEGTATAPGSPTVRASGERLSQHATLQLTGLLPSRTYSFTAQAIDRAGNAVDVGGRFQTALDLTPPGGVGALSVLDLLNGTLRLSWAPATDDVGVAFYRVYRSEDGVNYRPVAEVKDVQFEDHKLPLEKAFTYQVVAVDYGGNEGPGSERLRASATAVPRLTVGSVAPTVGSSATTFRYVVTYASPGGVAPTYVRVILDGVAQEMTLQPGGTPEDGLVYVYETRLAPHKRDAPHNYTFEASDGRYTVRFPELGEPLRGPLVSGDAEPVGPLAGAVGFAKRVPFPGAAGFTAALAAAAAIALALRRRSLP